MVSFFIISFINVFLHIFRSILVIKSTKLMASIANCITYTFSAVVVKSIADNDLVTSIVILGTTNFLGCYCATWIFEKLNKKNNKTNTQNNGN